MVQWKRAEGIVGTVSMYDGRRGFTIIELLVVVAVIAVLASLLMPVFARAKGDAWRAACASNLRSLGAALRMYLNTSGEIMPLAATMPSLHLNDWPRICDVLAPYVDRPDAFRCPADTERTYYQTEGSSYEYNSMLGGRKVRESFLSRRFGEARTFVMYDYESFHGEPKTRGSRNYLFADGHVGDLADK